MCGSGWSVVREPSMEMGSAVRSRGLADRENRVYQRGKLLLDEFDKFVES
jgi:hypothetical protein